MVWFRHANPKIEVVVRLEIPRTNRPALKRELDSTSRLVIPTDLMFAGWRHLFPAERMLIFGGHKTARGIRVTSFSDVTESKPSAIRVRACPDRMARALIDFERTGAHLAVWMHSHPGEGPRSTHPSSIDLKQEDDFRQHYSDRLVCIIAVQDGWCRHWGQTIERGDVRIDWRGQGVDDHTGEPHVYRLKLA